MYWRYTEHFEAMRSISEHSEASTSPSKASRYILCSGYIVLRLLD